MVFVVDVRRASFGIAVLSTNHTHDKQRFHLKYLESY